MTVFENTLKKLVPNGQVIAETTAYMPLKHGNIMRVDIIDGFIKDHFDRVKCTIVNPSIGVVDTKIIKFNLFFSKVRNVMDMENYIACFTKNPCWTLGTPKTSEMNALKKEIENYMSIFNI